MFKVLLIISLTHQSISLSLPPPPIALPPSLSSYLSLFLPLLRSFSPSLFPPSSVSLFPPTSPSLNLFLPLDYTWLLTPLSLTLSLSSSLSLSLSLSLHLSLSLSLSLSFDLPLSSKKIALKSISMNFAREPCLLC